jgi:dTDP-4-amino-4,6-dideoxygalactose transaminase
MADRRNYRIRFQSPELPSAERIESYFRRSRESRWFANRGPCQEVLEDRLVEQLGGQVDVVPVASATAGLMVAIRALAGVATPRRRHVLVPSFTFIASVSAILWAGFEPVFVDVDPAGWHVDPDSAERAADRFGSSIALILGCSTFGTLQPDQVVSELAGIAHRLGARFLVDSAAAFGSTLPNGQHRGCDGDLDVYSFHATKPFAIGEGGVVVTRDPELSARAGALANFGFDVRHLVGDEIGLNAKLDEWHCATALAVLDGFPEVLAARRERSSRVKAALKPHGFSSQAGSELASNQFVAVLAPNRQVRAECLRLSRERGIECRAYYRDPLHTIAPLQNFATVDELAVTTDLAQRALSLPLANDMPDSDLDEVIEVCVDAASSR